MDQASEGLQLETLLELLTGLPSLVSLNRQEASGKQKETVISRVGKVPWSVKLA